MIKIVFIGLGWATRNLWYPAFAANSAAEIVAGADNSEFARRNFSNFAALREVYRAPEKIFNHSPDLCVIATPNSYHGKMAKLALSRGAHVLIEKPVCTNTREWTEINALAEDKELKIFTSQAARFRSDVALLRENINNETIGEVRAIELEWIRAKGIPSTMSWFISRKKSGGGAFIDLGWHLVDLCLYLTGLKNIRFVSGFAASDFIGDKSFEASWKSGYYQGSEQHPKPTVEDTASCHFYLDKIPVQVRAAWASHRKKDLTRILIMGSRGELELQTLFGFSDNGPETPVLTIRQKGQEKNIPISYEAKGIEYLRQAGEILRKISAKGSNCEKYQSTTGVISLFEDFYKKTIFR